MRRAGVIALVLAVSAAGTMAQRTTRGGRTRAAVPAAESVAVAAADTIAAPAGAVRVSGYDKTLASRRESFFLSNGTDSATIVWVLATIDYLDEAGRQLHRRRAPMRCHIPPGQTRRVDIPSWDRQGVYYYRASEPRRRVQASAAPFEVSFTIDSIAVGR